MFSKAIHWWRRRPASTHKSYKFTVACTDTHVFGDPCFNGPGALPDVTQYPHPASRSYDFDQNFEIPNTETDEQRRLTCKQHSPSSLTGHDAHPAPAAELRNLNNPREAAAGIGAIESAMMSDVLLLRAAGDEIQEKHDECENVDETPTILP